MNRLDRGLLGFARAGMSVRIMILALAMGMIAPAFGQTSGTWQSTGSLNLPRTGHTATLLLNGQVLVAGGKNSSGNFVTVAELYNPSTGRWSTTGAIQTGRFEDTATLLMNGEVLVAGGVDSAGYTSSAELYNPSTGKWTTTGNMTVPRAFAGAALLANGEVLVAGGANLDGTSGNTSELYNPASGKWTATGNLPIAESAPATLLPNGQVLVAGGDYADLYNPTTGEWAETPRLYYIDSTGTSATLLANGDVLIFGNHLPSYASQFYSPSANTWSRTLSEPGINNGPLVTLANGEALIAGGSEVYSGKSSATAKAALYNPSTNTWAITGSLKQAVFHTAMKLQNGQVLAVGGSDAELYTP